MTHDETMTTSAEGLTRRSIMRTASHAAWAAPVIVAATAAPALAASGPALVTTQVSGTQSGSTLTITVTLTNANTGAAGSTSLAVAALATAGTLDSATPTITSADSWTFTSSSGNTTSRTYNFSRLTFPGAATTSGTRTTTLVFTVAVTETGAVPPLIPANSAGTLTATPAVATGTATAGLGSWT